MLRNTKSHFGRVSITIHWLSAAIIIGQFVFGLYMLSLDYYDPDYNVLPHYHKSIGILFAILLVFRLLWNRFSPSPEPVEGTKPLEIKLARLIKKVMLSLLILIVILGYLISTAKGNAIHVFNWFEVPASITFIPNQEDIAGFLHYWLAIILITCASVHALAALKHHFIDKNKTLLRMLGKA